MESNKRSPQRPTSPGPASPPSSAADFPMSVDAAEQTLITAERHIARLRAIQMEALEVVDVAQVATSDGARDLSEWVAARADVSVETARTLVRTMRRTAERPELREPALEADTTFDRLAAAARIAPTGDPDPFFAHLDIAGVVREGARRERVNTETETRTSDDQHLIIQPSLDESWWRIWGGLDGATGAAVDSALARMADQLPDDDPNMPSDSAWRRAIALGIICTSDDPLPTQVTVFVDADEAAGSTGEAGVYLEAGPRVGKQALEGLLCDATLEVVVVSGQGQPMRYGRQTRSIPPSLRRAIIHRDGNRCAIDGCRSRNRLQVHHIIPWSQGGPTDPENLLTVCWYHHQVAIHRHGLSPYRHPTHGRWRLGSATRSPPT
jgi:hypothetical protein